jgi:GxxExxY protein
MDANTIATCVIDSAVEIHRKIGPGLRDSVYATSLADALTGRGFTVERQESIPTQLRGKRFKQGPQAPLVVRGTVLVELKSLDSLSRVHKKQMLTYLKLSPLELELLIKFGGELLKATDCECFLGVLRVLSANPQYVCYRLKRFLPSGGNNASRVRQLESRPHLLLRQRRVGRCRLECQTEAALVFGDAPKTAREDACVSRVWNEPNRYLHALLS